MPDRPEIEAGDFYEHSFEITSGVSAAFYRVSWRTLRRSDRNESDPHECYPA